MKSLLKGLRTLLVLGRVSNLPTVWSNLITGWIMAWVIDLKALALLLVGGSLLYIGGMFLNDFCDADFDARYCPERPIPAGKISRRAVGVLAVLWFTAGLACLIPFGWLTARIALLLLAAIVLYDFRHKNVSWAPLAMGTCRFLLYPMAISTVGTEVAYSFFWGAVLGFYVAGISYFARGESRAEKPIRWALLLLLLPVAVPLGLSVLDPPPPAIFMRYSLSFLLFLSWIAWLLIPLWRKTNRSIGRVVSGLLAGIVLVDVIALAPLAEPAIALFPLFILALLLQRVIPAT